MRIINKYHFAIAVLIFIIEVLIALFAHDGFVRPYLGDVLVVILIYCFLKSFFDVPPFKLSMLVLAFSFFVEFLQYISIVKRLGLEESEIARTVIGTYFTWHDLVAYVTGIAIVLTIEYYAQKRNRKAKASNRSLTGL